MSTPNVLKKTKSNQNPNKKNKSRFWQKGFEILHNFQDRLTMEKKLMRARDPILLQSKYQEPDTSTAKSSKDSNREQRIPDITDLLSQLP